MTTGGGAKGAGRPRRLGGPVQRFIGVDHVQHCYVMTEMTALNKLCEHGRYHFEPWVIPFVVDPQDGSPLPADEGEQTGRMAIFDLLPSSYWGGFVTGDEVTLRLSPCPCGRTTAQSARRIERYSEKQAATTRSPASAPRSPSRRARIPDRAAVMSVTAGARHSSSLIRGRLVESDLVAFGARAGQAQFSAPDPQRIGAAVLRDPGAGRRPGARRSRRSSRSSRPSANGSSSMRNAHLQEALAQSEQFADLTPPLIARVVRAAAGAVRRADAVREVAEQTSGRRISTAGCERRCTTAVRGIRASGARTVHMIAGNSPLIAALSIIRNAICRSDAIVKTPSNDPLTALAIARTMAEIGARPSGHADISVAYWKGGDTDGRGAAVPAGEHREDHRLGRVRLGLTRGPLHPAGARADLARPEASADDHRGSGVRRRAALGHAAQRAATDIGALNQLGCVNARVVYVVGSTDGVTRLGEAIYRQSWAPRVRLDQRQALRPGAAGASRASARNPDFYG